VSTLPALPAIEYLRHGEKPLTWFDDDPQLESPDTESIRENNLEDWLSHWRQQWPRIPESQSAALGRLQGEIIAHLRSMEKAHSGQQGDNLRERLEALFKRFFRRYAQSVIAVFCHLGLTALDVERIRGGLITRVLFPPVSGVRQ
jgi:broad specificity phosphatase PhoE